MTDIIEKLKNMSSETKFIFSVIQKNGPLTKAKILDLTNLKLTTLNRIAVPLEKEKLIIKYSFEQSTGGRKPVLYDVNSMEYAFIGIDISRVYTEVIFTDLKMSILFKERFQMNSFYSPINTVNKIKEIYSKAVISQGVKGRKIIFAGLGIVGPLDLKNGLIKNPSNFIAEGWKDVPIKNMLEKSLDLKVYVENGTNAAVFLEYIFGKGKGFKNIAYINCGLGIRTGAISEGRIIRTINDAEDAFGHMVINVDGEKCSCGNFGCIECYCSITAITKKFIEKIKSGRKTSIIKTSNKIGYIDICFAAEMGDELALEVIKEAAEIFGTALANFINLLNPEMLILSGTLIMRSEIFYKLSVDAANKKCYRKRERKIFFNKGGLFKDDAISIGSIIIAMEYLLKE